MTDETVTYMGWSISAQEQIDGFRREVRELEDENAKLREELSKARDPQRIGGQADPSSFVYAIEQLREFRWQHATNDEDAIPYINNVAAAHERENAKLREQMERLVTLLRNDCDIDASWDGLRRFWSIGLTEDGCLMRDRACKAEAENARLRAMRDAWAENDARLRELVRHLRECTRHNVCAACEYADDACDFDYDMRELGMEVTK